MNSRNKFATLLRSVLCPEVAVRSIIRRLSIGSVDFRLSLQALQKPYYAYGVKQAVYLASKLQHSNVSVIEFGVARGAGLLALEHYAAEYGKRAGIEVEVIGFDTGVGLPAALDYRDLGYVWKRGSYKMDVEELQKKLKVAKLLLGDVQETVVEFLRSEHAPIGFISFDLDYYSSTVSAFQIFRGTDRSLLPRVLCYFDDVVSDGHQLHCAHVGELRAIREFNEAATDSQTLAPIGLMTANSVFPAQWMDQLWVYHRFQHFEYNTYIGA